MKHFGCKGFSRAFRTPAENENVAFSFRFLRAQKIKPIPIPISPECYSYIFVSLPTEEAEKSLETSHISKLTLQTQRCQVFFFWSRVCQLCQLHRYLNFFPISFYFCFTLGVAVGLVYGMVWYGMVWFRFWGGQHRKRPKTINEQISGERAICRCPIELLKCYSFLRNNHRRHRETG